MGNHKYIVDTESLIALLFFVVGNEYFCSNSQIELFNECRSFQFTIVIPAHCVFEVFDKIRLKRLPASQISLTTTQVVERIKELLETYDCLLDELDESCLGFIANSFWTKESQLSVFMIQKMAFYYDAIKC